MITAETGDAGGQPAMTTAELTQELRLVEEDLARLRKTAVDLRRRIGDRDEEPTDAAERSALIEAAEEQEALIDQLEARREQLLRRLGGPTGADRESHRLRGLQLRALLSDYVHCYLTTKTRDGHRRLERR